MTTYEHANRFKAKAKAKAVLACLMAALALSGIQAWAAETPEIQVPGAANVQEALLADAAGSLEGEQATAQEPQETNSVAQAAASELYQVKYEQVSNTRQVKVSFPKLDELIASDTVDTARVVASMKYDTKETRRVTTTLVLQTVKDSPETAVLNLPSYGAYTLSLELLKGDSVVYEETLTTFGIVAKEYNVAPLSGSFPVLTFSLSLWDIAKTEDGTAIPTMVMLERASAYDWEKLPENVYPMPYLTEAEIGQVTGDTHTLFNKRAEIFAKYVADLYALDETSHFNLYINDYHIGLVQSILYANGIPKENYSITLISDGVATYSLFNQAYAGSNASSQNATLIEEWEAAKASAYQNHEVAPGFENAQPRKYAYVVRQTEPNSVWLMARTDQFRSGDNNVFAEQAKAQATQVNIKNMLQSLEKKGEGTISEFKSLYNFNDEYFADAHAEGKEIMLMLGSWVDQEPGFEDYARFVKAYYGDKYSYYYKGHPASPTGMHPSKQEQLAKLDIVDVDSSVAAEIITFFNPDIFMSGYASSTWQSVPEQMANGLFNSGKKAALAMDGGNYGIMDWFISPIGEDSDKSIQDLCVKGNATYLVEFSDAIQEDPASIYSIALWDSKLNTIKWYANLDSGYDLVKTRINGVDHMYGFPDVAPDHWYVVAGAMAYVHETGYIAGYADGLFGPWDPMTRAQAATILWRAYSKEFAPDDEASVKNETGMSDVLDGVWYTSAANWAVSAKVINGVEMADGTRSFNPDEALTREELCTMMANYLASPQEIESADPAVFNSLPDKDTASSWSRASVIWALDNKVISGWSEEDGTKTLRASEKIQRSQMAAILMNVRGVKV